MGHKDKNLENSKCDVSKKLLTLDEAIAHAERCVDNTPCGRNHKQLADWLKELRCLKSLGNMAAMHDALEFIKLASDDYETYGTTKAGALDVIYEKACAALASPPHTGMWKNGRKCEYEYAYCSACGRAQWAGWDTHKQAEENIEDFAENYKFCPGCGAKMEGGIYVK